MWRCGQWAANLLRTLIDPDQTVENNSDSFGQNTEPSEVSMSISDLDEIRRILWDYNCYSYITVH